MKAARGVITAAVGLACVRCSLLLDDTGLAGADPPADAAATLDGRIETDAGAADAADARSFPDGATVWTGNGHAYEVVVVPDGIVWITAKAHALGRGGHLATLTSEEENAFVYLLAEKNALAWSAESQPRGPWIGAEQKSDAEPDGGWTWVTGEPFAYTAWHTGEPDNGLNGGGGVNETVIHFYAGGAKGPTWNDWEAAERLPAYVVEYE